MIRGIGDLLPYRYASSLGDRYAMPIYFATLEEVQRHERLCKRLIGDLTGQESMRIEVRGADGQWVPAS